MAKFEVVNKYEDCGLVLPVRQTGQAAGYDFQVAEDTIVLPYHTLYEEIYTNAVHEGFITKSVFGGECIEPVTLNEMTDLVKTTESRPTLVPTGIKCQLDPGTYLELSVRSSCPLKHWLILANGVGIIDADYYNNQSNEGHIFFQVINLSPLPIILKKGDSIGQGIIKPYLITEDDIAGGERTGGFGSTDK